VKPRRPHPTYGCRVPIHRIATAVVSLLLVGGLLATPSAATAADHRLTRSAPTTSPTVVGGGEASSDEFGFVGALLQAEVFRQAGGYRAQYCAASLVNPTTMITAAHCLVDQRTGNRLRPKDVLVGFGSDLASPTLRVIALDDYAIHPGYRIKTNLNDIAVLYLSQPVNDFPTVELPVGADVAAFSAPGTPAKVAGWGNTSSKRNRFPRDLQVANVEIFPNASCGSGKAYRIADVTFDGFTRRDADRRTMICAAGVDPAGDVVDACDGDSGGPLTVGSGDARRLMGVVSWGQECATLAPGVYTRITAATDFLIAAGALPDQAPILAPTMEVLDRTARAIRLRITAPSDGTSVSAVAATATDSATGQTYTCSSAVRSGKRRATCLVEGVPADTEVRIEAISGNAAGNSPVSAPTVLN